MSQENVEIVRTLAEGFQHRQHERAFEFYDPEIEWDASRGGAGPRHRGRLPRPRGRPGLLAELALGVERSSFEIQDVVDAGDEVVLLVRNQRQWGRHSGIATECRPMGWCSRFATGRSFGGAPIPDQESALEAAGLSE